jgi:putative sterol carrier protein
MSEISNVFEGLAKKFQKDRVKTPRTFYFSLGEEEKWTVALDPEKCSVTKGKPEKDADCFFKASEELFLDVWNGKHKPGMKDFMTGAIKSNNPLLLKEFIEAFQPPQEKKEEGK